jgi:hypothetical protein
MFNDTILRDGFAEHRTSGTLTTASGNGTAFQRQPGVYECIVMGTITITAGSGTVTLKLQGSNDNSNWHVISELNAESYYSTTADVRVLNADGGSVVECGRWKYLRVIAADVSAGATWSIAYKFAGIGRNSSPYLDTEALTRTTTATNGTAVTRRAGARYATVQVVMASYAAGGLSGYKYLLQGSPDGGTTWVEVASSSTITGNGATWLEQDGATLIDFGGFATYRMRVEDVGTASGGEAYTVTYYIATDDGDWLGGDPDAIGGAASLAFGSMVVAKVTNTAAEAGNARAVTWQLMDLSGNPIREARTVDIVVYDTSLAGATDLSTNGTISSVTTGTLVAGSGTNRVTVTSDANGVIVAAVADASAETIYAAVVDNEGPKSVNQVIVQSEQATLAFA